VKNNRGEAATTRTVETGTEMLMTDNMGIQQGDPEKGDIGVAIGTSTPNLKPPAAPANEELVGICSVTSGPGSTASPVLPSYPVGRNISLPFGQLLPWCARCNCGALIQITIVRKHQFFLCLDHGFSETSDTRNLVLRSGGTKSRYAFISPDHETAIPAVLA